MKLLLPIAASLLLLASYNFYLIYGPNCATPPAELTPEDDE